MDSTEVSCIAQLKTKSPAGYNLTAGGEGNLGWKPSKEIREHMGAPNGSHWTVEAKAKRKSLLQWQWDNGVRSKESTAERMKGNSYTKGRKVSKEEMLKRHNFKPGNQHAKGFKQTKVQKEKRSKDQTNYWIAWRLRRHLGA
jgi:hypothetical protein